MNSNGHNNTPQVRLIERPLSPNKEKLNGVAPNTFSKEKIFPPIHSAMSALATKNAVMNNKIFVGRSFKKLVLMQF